MLLRIQYEANCLEMYNSFMQSFCEETGVYTVFSDEGIEKIERIRSLMDAKNRRTRSSSGMNDQTVYNIERTM